MSGRPSRWKGPELDALRVAYETTALMVDDLAIDFRTSRGHVCRLARRNGWKRRGAERLPDVARRHMRTYRERQRYFGRALALEVVAGLEP